MYNAPNVENPEAFGQEGGTLTAYDIKAQIGDITDKAPHADVYLIVDACRRS